jgi:hypothetical protein
MLVPGYWMKQGMFFFSIHHPASSIQYRFASGNGILPSSTRRFEAKLRWQRYSTRTTSLIEKSLIYELTTY